MEEARRRKEDEVEEWQHRVSLQVQALRAGPAGAAGKWPGARPVGARLVGRVESLGMFRSALPVPAVLLRPKSP